MRKGLALQGSREDATHIRVHNDLRNAEGEAGDCCCGVGAHTGQGEQLGVRLRHLATMPLDHNRGCFMQSQRAARISESAPGSHGVARSGGS